MYSMYFDYPSSLEEVAAKKKGLVYEPSLEDQLRAKFALLNDAGKMKVLERVDELMELQKYRV